MSDTPIEEVEFPLGPATLLPGDKGECSGRIAACMDGEWLPAVELFERIKVAASMDGPLTVDLSGLEHLQAAPLQVLIATSLEWGCQGRHLTLLNVSDSLKRWFSLSGANFN
jgi:anti-anti-sigma regulatory factor